MGKYRTRELTQRVRYALLAGVAGAFLIPQVAAAAPTGEHDYTAGVTVGRAVTASGTGTDTNITATAANNVIKWADYSVKQGETVNYDGKNYLNIVTGGNTSAINGTINNAGGDIYLVNPNGVIFGKTASVNVGNLYVSTQDTSTVKASDFETSGTPPLSTAVGDVGKADVVNMGSITANKVEVYGRSIRILDAANVHATTSPVILHTDTAANGGYAHIGHQSGAEPAATAYEVNGANAVTADNYYQLVSTPTEFQSINSGLTKNYMLANDIDFYDSTTGTKKSITPIGSSSSTPFKGKIEGNFYKVKNYTVQKTAGWDRYGLFGEANGAYIENLGITGVTIELPHTEPQSTYVGGLVGYTTGNTLLRHVYVTDSKIEGRNQNTGGLVGGSDNTIITESYSKAETNGGGILGYANNTGTVINDVYGDVTPIGTGTYLVYGVRYPGAPLPTGPAPIRSLEVNNSYTTGTIAYTGLTAPPVNSTYTVNKSDKKATLFGAGASATAKDMNAVATYAGWSINNTGAPGAKWRIYEGRTLPLLTAFMDGTATATYDIRYFNANRTLNTESATTAKSNNGADITTGLTYNSQYIKIVGKDGSGADVVGGKSNVVTYAGAMQYNADGTPNLDHIYDYVSAGTNDFDKTNGIRNAGTKAILWSDQDGPNLRGVNVTIGKRKVDMTVAGDFTAERQYNGKRDVKDAFIKKVLGGISPKGFTREDSDPNHPTVSLNTTGFTATMVDKHVGTGKVANFGGSIGLSGEDKDNYDFDGNLAGKTGKVDITKAPLLLSFRKKKADDRVYDGTSVVRDDAMKQSVSPGNISIDTTIAAGSRGEVMTDETGTADVLALAVITDPKYTDTEGNEQIHQGAHKLQYTNVKLRTDGIYSSGQDYELYYTPDSGTEKEVTNDTVYLDGSIIRRQIKTGDFKVYHKTDNSAADATKVYDGTATYDLNDPRYSDIYLSSNVGATDDDTGVVARDQGHITFLLQNGTTATFMTDEPTPSETKNVKTAKKIAYKVHADADTHTDGYGGHLLDDYWVVNDKDTALTESTNFNATGKGTITPKALTATVVNNHITKVYDAKQNQTDGNRNDIIGDALVTLSGFATVNGVLESRTNTSTAMYASPNVAWDNTANAPTSQTVTYTAKFDRGTGDEVDNYTFDQTPNTTTVTDSAAVAGSYTGTITPRPITITMGTVDKIYDGTAVNTKSNITGLAGKTAGDNIAATVLADDGITAATLKAQHAAMLTAGTAHSSFGRVTGSSFAENVNASNGREHDVRYQNVGDVLQEALAAAKKHNYTIDDTIYGKGTINRRLIEKSDFKVRDKDGGIANATRAYDGTNVFALKAGETLVAKTATAGTDTGVVDKDKNNIFFTMTGNEGHFTSDAAGANHTSHKSEAKYVAYDVIADSHDKSVSPLTNYYFGTSGTDKRDLETVNAANPDAVVAAGTITPAQIQAQTKKLKEKVYDGMAEHTDGNRNILTGAEIVALPLIADATGQPTNTSSAAYINKDVERDSNDAIIEKAVNYTAQLTGKYADDYEIVDAGNHVISTLSGTGDSKTVTATRNNVANMGKITPRKLNITMASVLKVYDTNAENTAANNTATAPSGTVDTITDDPKSSVIGTILSGESTPITKAALGTAWRTRRDNNGATSTYGHKGSTPFSDANASAATNGHDVVYHDMDKAFKDAFGTVAAGNYTVDADAYGKGTITPKAVDPNRFDVVDAHGNTVSSAKTYDGTSDRPIEDTWKIQSGTTTGLYAQDASLISFALSSKGAYYIDKNGNKTAQTTNTGTTAETDIDAVKAAYHVTAHADVGHEKLLKNYTLNGQTLDSGEATVYGSGKITRRTINIGLSETSKIDKVYDGTRNLVDDTVNGKELHHSAFVDADAKANVVYATGTANDNKLVRTKNGAKVDDNAVVTVAGSYADKNVARNPAREIIDKVITYKVRIDGNAGKNYQLSDGTTTVNAENGMNLSATGKITPKDLSGAFAKITKVYDGTTEVNHAANPTVTPAQVGFTAGAVIAGDDVTLATHNEVFQSANVRGDGTTKTIDGTEQKNWINYTNVTLTGADEGNYELKPDANGKLYGLGEIKPLELNPSTVTLVTTQAEKVYDGGVKVKKDGSDAISAIKNYITGATVTVGGSTVSVLPDLELQSAEYDTKNVVGGSQPRVTYHMKYKGTSGNFTLAPGAATFDGKGNGVITPKDVTATLKGPLTKVYDATRDTISAAKNATTGAAVATADDLVTFVGLVAGDGATNATTATFDNKNVGTNKTVTYDIKLDTESAGNYNIKYNGSAITALIPQAGNTITKRKVDVTFGEQHKPYDGLSTNTSIDASVSAADAAVLNLDHTGLANASNKLTNLTATGTPPNIISNYGKRTGTGFTPDANAGTNKDVQYAGLRAAMNTSLSGDAGNYEFDTDGYGKGYIERATINVNDPSFTFTATDAKKVYDGTNKVLWKDPSSGIYYGDNSHVKNYISTIGVTLNGNWVDLSGSVVMDLTGTKYSSPNATNSTPDTVTYKFRLNTNNIIVNGGTNEFTKTANGTIDRRVLKLGLAQDSAIDKIYDANAKLIDTNTRHYDKFIDDDASGNVIYAAGTTNDNKLVRTANGAAVNDGAKMTITANYVDDLTNRAADKNVARDTSSGNVTAKDIAYNVKIDAANGGKNYTLDHNGTTANAEDGLKMNASGTISPRKITLAFADADKMYDTMSENTLKNISSVTPGNSDGRGAATLTADGITAATFDMTGVASDFGKGTTDATFTADPNVVLNASGTVSPRSKDVQYRNLKDTLNAQPYAGNYEIADTSYGKGAITKRTVTRNDFDIQIDPATKEYDGTDKVVWTDSTTHISYNDLEHAKNYFTSSTLKLRNSAGTVIATKNINLADIELLSAAYNGTNVVGTNQVNYGIRINTTNFDFTGSRDDVRHTAGTITPRDLATKLPTHLIKEYDGETTFNQDNKDFVNAMANEKLTGIVARDANKVHLAVTGTYSSKNASAETREDALAPVHTPGRTVDYALTLTGSDPATLSNYTLSTTNVNGRAADIYKKKLTVDVGRKEKDYDGTADVTGLTTGDIIFHGILTGDTLSLDTASLTKINGQYLDDAGQPSADVRRNANHAVTDKAVGYTGLNAALIDRAARDTTAGNYRVDDTKNYTVGDAKGQIRPLHITPYDPTPTDPHNPNPRVSMAFDATGPSKVYDGTATVKHNGVGTADALKNYLTGAKVILGGTVVGGVVTGGTEVNIWKDIAIDPTKTHYDDKMVGTGKNVTYGLKYTGNNFTIDDFTRSVSTGIITAKDVTVAVKSPLTKAYDATTDVLGAAKNASGATVTTADDLVKLTGLIAGDRVSNTTTAFYDTKNAGTGKTVAYTPSLSGADAVNYRLVDASGVAIPTTGLTSPSNNEITKRKVNVTFGTVSKPYDGTAVNTTIDAAVSAADAAVLNLDRTGLANASNKLTNLTATGAAPNITSAYGKRDHGQFTANPNVVRDANNNVVPNGKDVQYAGLRAAMNTTLGSDAGNYEFDTDGYGKGTINPVTMSEGDFALSFRKATKEYDGTRDVHNAAQYLDKTASHASSTVGGTTSTITLTDDDYVSVDGKYDNKNAGDPTVHYKVRISNKNFDFGTWDGIVRRDGDGHIDKRKLIADPSNYLTKEYDGKADIIGKARNAQGTLITGRGDKLVKFHHYGGTPTHPDDGEDTVFYKDAAAGTVSNNTTAAYAAVDPTKYADKDVEWKDNVWNQGRGVVGDKNVKYTVDLTGTDATNYDVVHADGTAVTPTNPYVGKGRITPKEIVLKADPQERWINEGLPTSYTGTPMGKNLSHNEVPEIVPSDTPLPGTIDYSSPNARLRVGYYAVNGTYKAQGGTDGDSVSWNYRFIQDPANKTALYIGPYIPDYEYYKAMTQVSKMTPDEYAYENASLDRTNQYSRKPTAQVDPVPPAINVVKDGVDIRQNDINVLDDTVYTIVDEVFG